jgi:hypothetical protein
MPVPTTLQNMPERPGSNSWGYAEGWRDALENELLKELAPKINPAYEGWSTLETTAQVGVYLRVLGLTKKEAWKLIKERKLQ